MSEVQNELNSLDEVGIIAQLKTESDYRAGFINGVNKRITEEQQKVKDAVGNADEDILAAEANAVVAWL